MLSFQLSRSGTARQRYTRAEGRRSARWQCQAAGEPKLCGKGREGMGAERDWQPCGRSQWLQPPSAIGLAHSDTYCSLRRSHVKAAAALPQLPRSRRQFGNTRHTRLAGSACVLLRACCVCACVSSPRCRFDFHRRSGKKLKSGTKIYLSLLPWEPFPRAFDISTASSASSIPTNPYCRSCSASVRQRAEPN